MSEVRPDGKETYVQSGYLRTSLRKLDKRKSTPLDPVLSLRRDTAAKLPKGRLTKVAIPLYYEGHMYRAGSRIRVTVALAERRPACLGLRRDGAAGHRPGADRLQPQAPVPRDPPAGPGNLGTDAAAALPGPAWRVCRNFGP